MLTHEKAQEWDGGDQDYFNIINHSMYIHSRSMADKYIERQGFYNYRDKEIWKLF